MRATGVVACVAALLLLVGGVAAQYDTSLAMTSLMFCKASYCSQSAIQSWNCGASCNYNSGFQVKNVYEAAAYEMQAYSGYSPSLNMIVVAFRGSSNIPNWIADLTFTLVDYPSCSGCQVHKGFYEVWQTLSSSVLPDIKALQSAHPLSPVLIVGHSLGAAVSVHCAAAVHVTYGLPHVYLYNFGLPRVGNPAFAAWLGTVMPPNQKMFRVTHAADPVPHVPPMSWGFLHGWSERWYDNNGDTSFVSCNDSPTAEDPKCSDSTIPIDISDHLLYLGICTSCSCDNFDINVYKNIKVNITRVKQ